MERDKAWESQGQRERETENSKQALLRQHRARCKVWFHELWDPDLAEAESRAGHLTNWATQVPPHSSFLSLIIYAIFLIVFVSVTNDLSILFIFKKKTSLISLIFSIAFLGSILFISVRPLLFPPLC